MASKEGVCLREVESLSASEPGLPEDLVNLAEVRRMALPIRPHFGLMGGVEGVVVVILRVEEEGERDRMR